ncbi:MAG: hypothetical protein ACE148_09275 [Vicinamibacterales bacterium]
MTTLVLAGLNGSSPLGFLAAVGLLRIVANRDPAVRLAFLDDGTFRPLLSDGWPSDRSVGAGDAPPAWATPRALADLVAGDAAALRRGQRPWFLTYEKVERRGVKVVADLKAPPAVFIRFLRDAVAQWADGCDEAAVYAAAFGTSVAVDGKGNTKPTAFHFTAANQQFLGAIDSIGERVDSEWTMASLFEGHAARPGANVRWDPSAERNYALMANDPNTEGTQVDAPLEWLAFRGLPLFPTVPRGNRAVTTGVTGRGETMTFHWPLWSAAASVMAVRSLLALPWAEGATGHASRGVFACCGSAIRRSGQGFGSFSPSVLMP